MEGSTTPIASFGGFSDFDLDLSCLSPPASPTHSPLAAHLPTSAVSSPRSSRSPSFLSQVLSTSEGAPARKMSPTFVVPPSVATTVIRGSWPLMKYVGRGTPVDKTRRVEWGALGGEEVTEDGLLFSPVRSASLDSVTRSVSPDWNFLAPSSSTRHTFSAGVSRSKSRLFDQPPPELGPLPISTDTADDWSSLMNKVLGPTKNPDDEKVKTSDEEVPQDPSHLDPENLHSGEKEREMSESEQPIEGEAAMSPEEIQQLDTELGNNLGLNQALNLGLSLEGNRPSIFNLGHIPSSGGHDTPSVYSSDEGTTRVSRHPSLHALEVMVDPGARADTVIDGNSSPARSVKRTARTWWSRFVKHFRRVHSLLHVRHPKAA